MRCAIRPTGAHRSPNSRASSSLAGISSRSTSTCLSRDRGAACSSAGCRSRGASLAGGGIASRWPTATSRIPSRTSPRHATSRPRCNTQASRSSRRSND
jgi:hypothetical protein